MKTMTSIEMTACLGGDADGPVDTTPFEPGNGLDLFEIQQFLDALAASQQAELDRQMLEYARTMAQ